MRTALNGICVAAALPISTTGTFASSIPSVVPSTTARSASKRAASTIVAICVLSPISARKNATDGDAEHAPARRRRRLVVVERVGLQCPCRDGEERQRDHPAEEIRGQHGAREVAEPARERMVRERGDEDAGDDRQRLPEPRRQHECEELRLVADLAERDHARRHEEGFHGNRRVDAGVGGGTGRRGPLAATTGRPARCGGRGDDPEDRCQTGVCPGQTRRTGRIVALPCGPLREPSGRRVTQCVGAAFIQWNVSTRARCVRRCARSAHRRRSTLALPAVGGARAHRARRGRARRREDGARAGRAADRRAAPFDRQGLAHVLAEPGRFRAADDARVEAAGRRDGGRDRMAAAARAAHRAACQLRLRERGPASCRTEGGADACPGHAGDACGARRLARLPRDVHSGGRRPHARASGRDDGRPRCALGRPHRHRACHAAKAARRLAGKRGRARRDDRAQARAHRERSGPGAIRFFANAIDRIEPSQAQTARARG